jgi:hypothetical protein
MIGDCITPLMTDPCPQMISQSMLFMWDGDQPHPNRQLSNYLAIHIIAFRSMHLGEQPPSLPAIYDFIANDRQKATTHRQ